MDEQPGVSDEYRRVSAWPLFVAVGLALSEVGVVLNVIALSVGGLLLFVGSVAGIIQEAGYVERPWGLLGGLGLGLVAIGSLLIAGQAAALTADRIVALLVAAFTPEGNPMVIRGLSVGVAGLVAVLASRAGAFADDDAVGYLGE